MLYVNVIAWGLAILVLNVGAFTVVLRARRRPNARRILGRMLIVFGGLIFLAGPTGNVLALFMQHTGVGGETIDASQKARVLAETISEFINCVAFAGLAFSIPMVVTFALFLRSATKPVSKAA